MNIPFEHLFKPFLLRFLRSIPHCLLSSFLHSFSQIMLQERSTTGLLFLLAIGVNSPTMLLGSLLATIAALFTAKLCHFEVGSVQRGLYGFNAALVGIAMFYLLPMNFISLILVVFGGVFSALLMHFMMTRIASLPAFTTPFILTTWLIFVLIDYAGLSTIVRSSFSELNSITLVDYFLATLRGIAQVMLQDNWLSGAILLCALVFTPAKGAMWALTGSAVGMLFAVALSFSQEMVVMGIYGFNACLVAIALSARYAKKYWLITLGIFVSVLLTRAFEQVSLPALTAPFVLATWLMISLVKIKRHAIFLWLGIMGKA